jgi:hypothetical protein
MMQPEQLQLLMLDNCLNKKIAVLGWQLHLLRVILIIVIVNFKSNLILCMATINKNSSVYDKVACQKRRIFLSSVAEWNEE